MTTTGPRGWVMADASRLKHGTSAIISALQQLDRGFALATTPDGPAVATDADVILAGRPGSDAALPLLAWVPPLTPDLLGDARFQQAHGVRVNYVAGAMANGIASTDLVIAMARAGMLGFFGAAGLSLERIDAAIHTVQAAVGELPYGFNLIHSPQQPGHEQATVDLYLRRGVRRVSAAAFMKLSPTLVQYAATGLTEAADGSVVRRNYIVAKVSREEVAVQFLRPAPDKMLADLVAAGRLTPSEARLAARIPVAEDLTAEADSGGHTDNRAAPVLLPLLLSLRDRIQSQYRYTTPPRIGLAGGICTPASAAAAFAMGAAYVLTGTVNQACVESGTSDMVRDMLAIAESADVGMAPASDMFEQGVDVQVLKRGTLFAQRGHKLYRLWREHDSLESIPAAELAKVEKTMLRRPATEVWAECERFFAERDPAQLERAARDPKHKMALVFRWYLGLSSRWAIAGDDSRRTDVQVWCGPGIGAFNRWTAGTFLAEPANRSAVTVAANLMAGAAALTRASWLAHQGVDAGPAARNWTPRPVAGAFA